MKIDENLIADLIKAVVTYGVGLKRSDVRSMGRGSDSFIVLSDVVSASNFYMDEEIHTTTANDGWSDAIRAEMEPQMRVTVILKDGQSAQMTWNVSLAKALETIGHDANVTVTF